jgi:beta-lactamase class A
VKILISEDINYLKNIDQYFISNDTVLTDNNVRDNDLNDKKRTESFTLHEKQQELHRKQLKIQAQMNFLKKTNIKKMLNKEENVQLKITEVYILYMFIHLYIHIYI